MWPPTWAQFERAVKFLGASTLAYLELAHWGGRAAPLTFIATVLGVSELVKLSKNLPPDPKDE